jgi:hypothetical protein
MLGAPCALCPRALPRRRLLRGCHAGSPESQPTFSVRADAGRGEGNVALAAARGPASASRRAHLGSAPTCLAGGAWPGRGLAGPWRNPGERGRRLIPGIPCALGCRGAGPERATRDLPVRVPESSRCGSAGASAHCVRAPRSAPRAARRPRLRPLHPPAAGPRRLEAGEPRAARR